MQHATTYDTAKLKQAPGMVVHGERDHQLQSYVYHLHLLKMQLLKRRVLPARKESRSHFSLLFRASVKAESEIPMHKNTIVRVWV